MDTIRQQFSDWVTEDATLGVAVAAKMAGEGMDTEPTQCALERRVQRTMRHRSGETWSLCCPCLPVSLSNTDSYHSLEMLSGLASRAFHASGFLPTSGHSSVSFADSSPSILQEWSSLSPSPFMTSSIPVYYILSTCC